MTTLKRIPIDQENQFNTFYSLTSHLSKEEFQNFSTEWKEIDLFGPITYDNSKHLEGIKENLDTFRSLVLDNFDFAITGIEIAILLVSGIQNLLYRVMIYIYDMIYNQLEMLLRSGIYTLTVIPDFQVENGMSLPTTTLQLQAKNVYKKFYDIYDENVPYNFKTKVKDQEEKLLHDGLQIAERLRAKYEDATGVSTRYKESSGNLEFNVFGQMDRPYFKRNFQDLNQRLELLSKPYGIYEGLFLYFSFDISQNLDKISNLIKSMTGITFLFQSKSLNLANRIEAKKRRQITVVTERKLLGIDETFENEIKKSAIGQLSRRNDADDKLQKITLVPARIGKSHNAELNADNRAFILRCLSVTEESAKSSQTLYYNYLERIRSGNGTKEKRDAVSRYRYEFEIDLAGIDEFKLDGVEGPSIIPLDMFFESQKVFIFSSGDGEDRKIGEGYIYNSVPVNMDPEAKGNWHSINFSDLTGTTDWIREMQNILAGKKNTFVPNTMGLEELLASVKAIKKDIEDLLDMLDAIIDLLNIQIDFDGQIWAKYVREENYDRLASLLTDVNGVVSEDYTPPYKSFKPSANKTIQHHINEIRKLKKQYPNVRFGNIDEWVKKLDESFLSGDSKKIQSAMNVKNFGMTAEEANTVAGTILSSDLMQGGLMFGPVIIDQLFQLSKNTMIDSYEALGSAANDLKITLEDIDKEALSTLSEEDQEKLIRRKNDPNYTEVYDIDIAETVIGIGESILDVITNPIDSIKSLASSTWDVVTNPIESIKVGYESVSSGVNSAITAVVETKEMRYSAAYFSGMKNKLKNHVLYDPKTTSDFYVEEKFKHHNMMIQRELVRITPKLSTEFGFSQVLVSYLPKTGVFHPIAWLAKLFELEPQDGTGLKLPDDSKDEKPETLIEVLDRGTVSSFIEESSPEISQEKLKVSSEKSNPTPTPKTGEATEYKFSPIVPLYTNESLMTADDEPAVTITGNSEFKIHRKAKIKTPNVYYGVRFGGDPLKLELDDNPTDGDETKFKYAFEFKFTTAVDDYEDKKTRPRISRMEIYCGLVRDPIDAPQSTIFFENNNNRAFHVNSQNTHIFRLNQRPNKVFEGDCFITFGQLNKNYFYPYVLIRYNAGSLNRHHFENTRFILDYYKLYRIKG